MKAEAFHIRAPIILLHVEAIHQLTSKGGRPMGPPQGLFKPNLICLTEEHVGIESGAVGGVTRTDYYRYRTLKTEQVEHWLLYGLGGFHHVNF